MMSLTPQQDKLLSFIELKLREGRVAPSFEEMRDHLGLKSKSGVHRVLESLEQRGHIRRAPRMVRAIEILS